MTSLLTPIWAVIIGVLVLFLPGFAWLALFWDPDQDFFERLAGALGVSISLTALCVLIAFIFNWQFSAAALVVIYITLIIVSIWGFKRRRIKRAHEIPADRQNGSAGIDNGQHSPTPWAGRLPFLILSLAFIFILVWRFYQARGLVLPLWVDSVHHVQIVDLILQNHGLPDTFEPYMPVPFYYHYAFHAISAVFSYLGRMPSHQGVLILGQVISVGVALGVYRLGKALWADWRKAGLSAILAALVTQMPAYYLTWGRYTLLTGLVLLPLAMAAALDMDRKGATWTRFATFMVLTTGLLLTHYFTGLLLAVFLILLVLSAILKGIRSQGRIDRKNWMLLLLAAALGFFLASPWLYRIWIFAESAIRVGVVDPTVEAVETTYFPNYLSYLWRLLGPRRNHFLLFLAVPGLVLSLIRNRTRLFGLWTLFLVLISLPWGFSLAPFRPDHAVIVMFLPTAILIADLFISGVDWHPWQRLEKLKNLLLVMILITLIAWGIWETRSITNPQTILATRADLEALDWIERNTPRDSNFFINVIHWQYGSYRGVDGGWWITPITGRDALLPSALYAMGDRSYTDRVNSIARTASQLEGCSQEFWDLVRAQGLTHIYLVDGRGAVKADHFEGCQGVEMLYDKDGVSIYSIGDIIY